MTPSQEGAGMDDQTKQLHTAAKRIAAWMDYLMQANPGLERMCQSVITPDEDGVAVTTPVSLQQDYDALMAALKAVEGKRE